MVLAIQLPLAMFPLLWFTGSRKLMGSYRNGRFLAIAGWASCLLITALEIYGLPGAIHDAVAVFAQKETVPTKNPMNRGADFAITAPFPDATR